MNGAKEKNRPGGADEHYEITTFALKSAPSTPYAEKN
jgi:hypothetical protein